MKKHILDKSVSIQTLLGLASRLRSPDGENNEHDRALVEVVADAAGLTAEEHGRVAEVIGVETAS